MFVEG